MKKLKDLKTRVPLETRLKVCVQAHFLSKEGLFLGVPCDSKGEPIKEAMEERERVLKKAEPLIDMILKDVKRWKDDGCP